MPIGRFQSLLATVALIIGNANPLYDFLGAMALKVDSIPSSNSTPLGTVSAVSDLTGDNATAVRGDLSRPYKTVQAAVTAAVAGDSLMVCPGTYAENVVVPGGKSLSIRGVDRSSVFIAPATGVALSWTSGGGFTLSLANITFQSSNNDSAVLQGTTSTSRLYVRECSAFGLTRGLNVSGINYVDVDDLQGFVSGSDPLLSLADVPEAVVTRLGSTGVGSNVRSLGQTGGETHRFYACRINNFTHLERTNIVIDSASNVATYNGASVLDGGVSIQGRVTTATLSVGAAGAVVNLSEGRFTTMTLTYTAGGSPLSVNARGAHFDTLTTSTSGGQALNVDNRGGSIGTRAIGAGCTLDRDGDAILSLTVGVGVQAFVFGAGATAAIPPWPATAVVVAQAQNAALPATLADVMAVTVSGPAGFTVQHANGAAPQNARVVFRRAA